MFNNSNEDARKSKPVSVKDTGKDIADVYIGV